MTHGVRLSDRPHADALEHQVSGLGRDVLRIDVLVLARIQPKKDMDVEGEVIDAGVDLLGVDSLADAGVRWLADGFLPGGVEVAEDANAIPQTLAGARTM